MMDKDLESIKCLNKFSFESKMIICELFSQRLMTTNEVDLVSNINGIMPTELEIFMLYSVLYDDDDSNLQIDDIAFVEIINAIRNYWHPKWDEFQKANTYTENFLMISGLTQFAIQGNISLKFYRYNYFFSFINDEINMKEKFIDKFHCDYDEFRKFAFSIYLLLSDKEAYPEKAKFITFLWEKYRIAAYQLQIEKERFKEAVSELLGDKDENYYYGLKIQYLFPIIETNECRYIPIPYLLINATTDSLLHRLTEGQSDLRQSIGKNVLESYLYDLFTDIDKIEYLYKEQKYLIGREELLSPDVIVIENDYCMMFDTKLSVPNIKMRFFDETSIRKAIEIAAENVKKIYLQINNYDNDSFKLDKKIRKENVFGIIVQLEDYYVSRKAIYEKARQLLEEKNNILSDDDFSFMCSNIKIVGLSAIELSLIHGNSFLTKLINNKLNKEKWFDLYLSDESEIKDDSFVIRSVEEFINKEKQEFIFDAELAKKVDKEKY